MRELPGLSHSQPGSDAGDDPVKLVDEGATPDLAPPSPPSPLPPPSVDDSDFVKKYRVPTFPPTEIPDASGSDPDGPSDNESQGFVKEEVGKRLDDETSRRERRRRDRSISRARARAKAVRTVRKHGMLYVQDEDWNRTKNWVEDCHILVVTASMDAFVDKATKTMEDPHGATAGLSLNGEGLSAAEEALLSAVPLKFRIINELLRKEMQKLWPGAKREFSYNCDHVAPFRSIIPYEQAFRKRHQELEDQFKLIAQSYPDHSAVTRKEDHIPQGLSAYTDPSLGTASYKDDIDKARIILDGFRALTKLLDTDLSTFDDSFRRIKAGTAEALPFSHLWFLFSPGQEIITTSPKFQAYRVLQVTGGRRSLTPRENSKSKARTVSDLVIDCFHLDFDGTHFGAIPRTISIRPYDDTKNIMELPTYPLNFHKPPSDDETAKSVAEILLERGMKFGGLTSVSHRRYNGLSMRGDDPVFDTVTEIDSEVIVDFELAYRNLTAPEFGSGVIDNPTDEDSEESYEPGTIWEDNGFLKSTWTQWSQNTPLLRLHTPGTLSPEAYRLLPARVYGYVLLSRRWSPGPDPLDLNLITTIPSIKSRESDGFEKLVLPAGHRDIVRALVQTQARKADADGHNTAKDRQPQREFDVVKGKGKGLIILLHGAPGVGKTSTAECVAANAGRPLFPITCGDLGAETAQEVEANLEGFFDLARKWNCVLLLDEADVFLSARVEGNIRHNSLVSVFLRVLEYYSGILVLTTNRVGSFDEAIKSRVHCALYYPPLDKDKTLQVWKMNLDSLEARNAALDRHQRVAFDRREIEQYASENWRSGKRANRWNGRQIKNAFQTAVALAEWDSLKFSGGVGNPDGLQLGRDHFEKVAAASRHFDHYLETVRRADYVRVREGDLRDDNITNGQQWGPEDATDEDEEEEEGHGRKKGRAAKKTSSVKKRVKSETTKVSAKTKSKGRSGKSRRRQESESEESSSEASSSDSETSLTSDDVEADDDAQEESLPSPPPDVIKKKKTGTKKKSRKE